MEADYGALALIPPVIAIILCFITKRVLISLFAGVWAGAIIISSGNPITGITYSLSTIVKSMTDEWNANLLLFNILMGSGVALIWRLGGSAALTNWAKKRIKNSRQAGVGAWLLGMLVFFNDYVNAAIVGNAFRDIFDNQKISKEKLSYVLDSTAAPVATFFISDWIAFQIGMIQAGIIAAGITGVSAFSGFVQSITMNLYCIFAVLLVGIIVITRKDFGPMYKAEQRVKTTGQVFSNNSSPMMDVANELGEADESKAALSTFFLPIIALVGVTIFGFWWTGKGDGRTIVQILENSAPAKSLLWGAFYMTATGFTIAIVRRIMTVSQAMNTIIDGMKLMLMACAILVMAWTLGSITKDMNLAGYITTMIGSSFPFALLPVLIFFFGMFISFATGTSWGTMTILTPIAIPLTYSITGDATTAVLMSGVVFSGAIFGDHCSPISDTTVLASIFAGADHMDHVKTQIPYAMLCAGVAILMYLIYGFTQTTSFILIPAGLVILFLLASSLSAYSRRKYESEGMTAEQSVTV